MRMKKVAVLAAATLGIALVPAAVASAGDKPVRESVTIPMEGGWSAKGEITYPKGAKGRLPVVVLLHGSGRNDMNQTLAPGVATFTAVTEAVTRKGFAVLRFNKRGVVGVGPKLSDDPRFINFPKPYEQTVRDAAAVIRFAAKTQRVDPSRIYLLGHSEGTQVAANLVADPAAHGIRKPAGVIGMGVVGGERPAIIYYQLIGRVLGQLHEEFDFDGDGRLTPDEITGGLVGLPDAAVTQFRAILTDTDKNGVVDIDDEVEPILRQASGYDNYPNLTGFPQGFADYLTDFGRFPAPVQDLPKYDGPVLLLNGQTDAQTVVRGAVLVDAALTKAGNPDHRLITYPGVSHLMNVTAKYQPELGNPDAAVLRDITTWLTAHR
ncbi:alpha/beta hydrolase family protein [Actinoplanes couchii]|uniref:Alpha/beta hydrolase n=1 Tax=Actinoplanes couchii TaxID=403638 RepID=A0ABQ3XKN2_9ACTN|nr:alpha/beta fold hydrolase [Actinoplanes couchii]MDR6319546.1 pimeloyl-ACP methyl ester carboxylesterase [Actinoplanes couchii]GID59064.1 alpha/beta hydrolase [Actinoplanes couchii]